MNEKYTHLFFDNICADIADLQLISKFNKGICFLLCVIDIFSKYTWVIFSKLAWVISLKDKNDITIFNALQKYLKESYRKPIKI